MPGQSSKNSSSTSSKASTKPTTSEYRDSSSTYSFDPKEDDTRRQKATDAETKRLMQAAYKNSVRMGI
ncbi:hypothetical protein SAMD00023353_9400250 [Rosellinia necatrix]|uniref:Uncharacterized protein n=1 Tax=Rosellinia necatrix TaxID=77044 RepID=A0A1S8AAX0_ROSNE|nr:hypothetical protein SAMD00023353_9400250 [Rosellinia necatrix]